MTRIMTLLAALALAAVTLAVPTAGPATGSDPGRVDTRVQVYDYDLGDDAFRVPGFHAMDAQGMPTDDLAPIELRGRVYAPAHAAGRRLPVVVVAHGLFWSCADNTTGRTSQDWPCRGRLHGIHSERGYGYLGRSLAARGMVVVSISANGINAGELGEVADRARGVLVYEHLRLWQRLVDDGAGPLVGAFTDVATGRAASPDLRGAADFRDVGLLGHSRGGRGMMWAAADSHRHRVPAGVRFRAVLGLAAAEPPFLDHGTRRLKVTKVPLLSWIGGCDATGDDSYNRLARRGDNPVNIAITVHGANHNNLNSRWAEHSGLAGAEDDAMHPRGRSERCYAWDPDDLQDTLGYYAERRVARAYVTAFFARYLQGDRSVDDVLAGERLPARKVTRVDVERY
ncbi:hypothetical protein [Nocardioides sp. YIM 152315]|uniref:hypothetical protein n=1 Tax=Nocardioides sp. YIM 152315 TaxID=3031760 RepID=UPI0023DB7854|nr:hypothetical protein [Nocardioides sp. YIM 152315]MDF1605759.1 hypothetical protein [Nocardioides sp. YIM 152315]